MRSKLFVGSVALGAVFLFVGCGSTPTRPLPVEDASLGKFEVKLETKSRLLSYQRTTRCDERRRDAAMDVRGKEVKGVAPTDVSCSLIPGHTVVRTHASLPKGTYEVKTRGAGTPSVTADPDDPDALSGPDQDYGGAVELAENQTAKGSVNFSGANATNWVLLKGVKGDVSLLFLPETTGDVLAKLWILPPGSKTPRRAGLVPAKSKRFLPGGEGTYLVQFVGRRFTGETTYSLTRRDMAKSKGVSISVAVLDFYPLDGNSSVLVLKPHEAIKANDELRVSGKSGGKTHSLGRCVVTGVSDSQSTCRLDALPKEGTSDLRAQLVKEGEST